MHHISRRIAIKWTLPVTSSDFMLQTEVKLFDGNNDLVYNRVVNYPDTSLIITLVYSVTYMFTLIGIFIAQIDQPHNTI
jgi:hypothetical protein